MMKNMRQTTRNKIKANVSRKKRNENHGGGSYGRNMLMMVKTKIRTSITAMPSQTKRANLTAPKANETTNQTKNKIKSRG